MPAPQRPADPGLIDQLLATPTRFDLFYALQLLLRWMEQAGIEHPDARLRFHNRMTSAFAPGEVDAIWCRTRDNREIHSAEVLLEALQSDPGQTIHVSPACFGLLGNSSALPAHYIQAIAAAERQRHDAGPRVFLDLLGTRTTVLFQQAWATYRSECQPRADDQFFALQQALAGHWPPPAGALPTAATARYASLFRQRPVTAEAITAAISEYFDLPVAFTPFLAGWYRRDERTLLGDHHCTLGQGAMLGERCHRADLAAEIRIGPLNRKQYGDFLPGADGAIALKQMLAMFGVVNVRFRIRLVLRAEHAGPCQLAASGATEVGLGRGVFLHGRRGDSDDFCYDIAYPGTVALLSPA
jgi:type VI secretion system protein ImpH